MQQVFQRIVCQIGIGFQPGTEFLFRKLRVLEIAVGIGNEAAIGVIYSGEAIYTQRENADLEYVIPKEGTNVWIDSWVIPKNAKNKENAEAFINYMCKPEIALKNFDFITYSTPNEAARALIEDEDIRNSEIAFPDLSKYKDLETFHYLGEDGDQKYADLWKQVKSE